MKVAVLLVKVHFAAAQVSVKEEQVIVELHKVNVVCVELSDVDNLS